MKGTGSASLRQGCHEGPEADRADERTDVNESATEIQYADALTPEREIDLQEIPKGALVVLKEVAKRFLSLLPHEPRDVTMLGLVVRLSELHEQVAHPA